MMLSWMFVFVAVQQPSLNITKPPATAPVPSMVLWSISTFDALVWRLYT
jgi:hypothetical protein